MKHLCPLSLLLLVFPLVIYSQERPAPKHDHAVFTKIERNYLQGDLSLDQKVLYKFYAATNSDKLPARYRTGEKTILKCGTPAFSDYHSNRSQLSTSTISEIESINNNATIQASETFQSPSGKFNIHYETSGEHAVPLGDENGNDTPDYVEEVAAAADSSYSHEVQNLGYTDPIPTGQTYDVEIRNLEFIYGQTVSNGNTTYIQIENDFAEGFPPNDDPEGDQIGAIKATMAHEFKHAIQYEASNWAGETGNWLEMDATLMEEVVYDSVNDYYNYLESEESIFSNPEQSFYPGSYYHVTWALFFEENFGPQFWVNVWEIIKDNPQITMVEALTQQLGSPEVFNEQYIESQLWHYASGPENSSQNFGFEEATEYPAPPVEFEESLYDKNFMIPRAAPQSMPAGFAAKYYEIPVPENTDGDIQLEAASQQQQQKGVGLIAYYQDGRVESSSIPLADNESSFKMPNLSWNNIERLGLILTNSSTSSSGQGESLFVGVGSDDFDNTLSQNYPNPFTSTTEIRFTLGESNKVELKIYDTSGRLVRTLVDEELPAGLYRETFGGSNLASGIYFYQLRTGQQNIVKKMTLIK